MLFRRTTGQWLLVGATVALLLSLGAMLKLRKDSTEVGEAKSTPTSVSQLLPSATQAPSTPTPSDTSQPNSPTASSTAWSTATSTEIVAVPTQPAQPASFLTCGWSNVAAPVSGTLKGIAALSHDNIWAVGSTAGSPNAVIEHWDGASWNIVPSAGIKDKSNRLNAVAALSENDIWAVGFSDDVLAERNDHRKSLIMHWDGTFWYVVPAPETAPGVDELNSVAAISAHDVWAVGGQTLCRNGSCTTQTLTMHWDGKAWTQIPSPDPSKSNNWLLGVAAITSKDVWAVGSYTVQAPGESRGSGKILMMHWDGHAWSDVPSSETVGAMHQSLYGVAAVANDDVWAVGGTSGDEPESSDSLYMHWDGKAWSRSPDNVNSGSNGVALVSVAALSHDDVWAVGGWPGRLISHWNGKAWAYYPYSMIDQDYASALFSVAALSPTELYAVGGPATGYPGQSDNTVVMRYAVTSCSTRTATPTATATPTNTGTPTNTPTDTATPTRTRLRPAHFSADPIIPAQCGTWSPYSSADLTNGSSSINAVAVVSDNDIWAVGDYSVDAERRALLLHWNGNAWTHFVSPKIPITYEFQRPPLTLEARLPILNALAAVSKDDVWAVGNYEGLYDNQDKLALVMHWDGRAWSVVPSPALDPDLSSNLVSIAAIGADDVWAVGYTSRGDMSSGMRYGVQPLAVHWNGKVWNSAPLPNEGVGAMLSAVGAASTNDVWAVGSYTTVTTVTNTTSAQGPVTATATTFVPLPVGTSEARTPANVILKQSHPSSFHWNGKAWSQVPVPDDKAGSQQSGLLDVAVLSSGDVRALGFEGQQSKMWRWDSQDWAKMPAPALGTYYARPPKLSALSPTDMWVASSYFQNKGEPAHILLAHWDGSAWSTLAGPTYRVESLFGGLAATLHNGVWLAGNTGNIDTPSDPSFNKATIWRFDGSPGTAPAITP